MKRFIQFLKEAAEAAKTEEAQYDFKNKFKIMSLRDFMTDELEEATKLGAETTPLPDKEAGEYFDKVVTGTKTKKDRLTMPFVHSKNIEIKDDTGKKYNIEKLKDMIKKRPTQLLKQNEKMKHSGGTTSVFFNVNLPALRGLAVDEEVNEFIVVNTCPGAGACKLFCYAMKGGYILYPASSLNLSQTLTFLLNDPDGYSTALKAEIAKAQKANSKKGTQVEIRWHDAGDFFSPEYMELAFDVARAFPKVNFYAYTKMAKVIAADKPENFTINFSEGATPKQSNLVKIGNAESGTKSKHSEVVPKDMFWDLIQKDGRSMVRSDKGKMQYSSPEALQKFKQRIADKYGIDVDSILTYDEMMQKPKGTEPKWNVIVGAGDGDDSSARKDVVGTYLLIH